MLQNDIIFMLAVRNRSEDQVQLFTATPDYILPALLNHIIYVSIYFACICSITTNLTRRLVVFLFSFVEKFP